MTDPTPAAYDGTIERTADGGGVIRFERHLPYAIDDVWAAITDPDRLGDWWLPFDADISIDLREGGEMRFVERSDEPVTMTLTVLQVEPPTLLVHTHAEPGSTMRWELEATATGTILRLAHTVANAENAIGNCYVVGLHTSLSRLEPVLAGTPAPWDWDEFARTQAAYHQLGFAPEVEA